MMDGDEVLDGAEAVEPEETDEELDAEDGEETKEEVA
jgi:hypothetical protein